MLQKISKFRKYPTEFKVILVTALLESAKNEILLVFGIYKPVKQLHKINNDQIDESIDSQSVETTIRYISKAMKLIEKFAPWRPMCYNRAITAKKMLKSRGINTKLHVGFRKKDGKFDGHAWITYKEKFVTGFLPSIKSFNELEPVKEN